ncbi:TetR/AcrR family transcriptional regulator [Micromonospora sp. NBC_01699]|uniref:TetR/AcrR family transcriptional regulator n=1 Tax=Micromonospora sp. NBC_01699 TaxID=2975984 RepID=UPI002E37CC99|nr:TetR/AcrR family transcriptional regulator [Micromonospora sp. NBC_01699]
MDQIERRAADPVDVERGLRADRIIDAAGRLLVSWGYQRITIGEVARRAGVGKGTVYLHFPTKEALFLAVLTRSVVVLVDALTREIDDDPAAVLPGRVARFGYRRLREDPIGRALFTGDADTLGALAHSPELGDVPQERDRVIGDYLAILREHGVARTDDDPEQQRHGFVALLTGYLATEPGAPDAEGTADFVARIAGAAFETPAADRSPDPAAQQVRALLHRTLDQLHQRLSRQFAF